MNTPTTLEAYILFLLRALEGITPEDPELHAKVRRRVMRMRPPGKASLDPEATFDVTLPDQTPHAGVDFDTMMTLTGQYPDATVYLAPETRKAPDVPTDSS